MKKYWACSSSGLIEFEMTVDAVNDCSHGGHCDDDVEYWQKELNLKLDRKLMLSELLEYGCWDCAELNALDDDELEQKIIWVLACDISESPEFEKELL